MKKIPISKPILVITRKWKWFMYFGGALLIMSMYFQLQAMKTLCKSHTMHRWPKLLNSKPMPKQQIIDNIAKLHPNLPVQYWFKNKDTSSGENQSCGVFPSIFHLNYNNFYWQILNTRNLSFQFYSAYYDNRKLNTLPNVRVLTMVNDPNVNQTLFCQFWFENQREPVIVETNEYHYIWYHEWGAHTKGRFGPYLITCSLPESHEDLVPAAISIVEKPCDYAQNILKVIYNKPVSRQDFAICVKGLDFLEIDLSARLVEWLEFMFQQGVDKVFMYQLQVHPNMKKVLDYYQSRGKVDVRVVTLPGGQPNIPFLQHIFIVNNYENQVLDELIPYNDCFYRNIYSYKYVVVIDIDEIIIPLIDKDWNGLIQRIVSEEEKTNTRFAAYNARHVYFLDDMNSNGLFPDIPPYMHMLQHVYRAKNFTRPELYSKSFFNTERVITVHNHHPIDFFPDFECTMEINITYAQLHHYRKSCPFEVECKPFQSNPIRDTTIWKYKNILIPRINEVLKSVELIE